MKPQFDLRSLRPLSLTTASGLSSKTLEISDTAAVSRFSASGIAVAAVAFLALAFAGMHANSQQPSPIPNWPPDEPGNTQGQYAPQDGQYAQQPQYAQPQYQQPQYGQPQYPQQQQYGQPQSQQLPAYGQGYGQQGYGQQQSYADSNQGFAAPYQPAQALSPDRLEQMVAPIALYPDNLVSMVLAASTYPAQVAAADQWLHMQGGAPPEQIAAGANGQASWDPSVKALTAFPQVLDQLAQNLAWTTDLGNAYYNQPQDVMQTIQVMRSRAQAAGNLQTTPQEEVVQDQGNIEIAPPTPQVVYVPQYNPWAVYGQPVNPYPGFNILGAIGSFVGNAFLQFGPGIAMNAFAVTPFGWLGWGLDWLGHAIFFGNNVWSTHSGSVHDWGFAHGGARYWGGHGELAGFRQNGGWANRGGWQHNTFRSGLDRSNFANGAHPTARAFNANSNGGNFGRGYQGNGNTYGRGNGYQSSGNTYGGYGQRARGYGEQAYNREPQSIGRPQQYGGASQYAQGRPGVYGGAQPSYGNNYGRESAGSSGVYSRPLQNYGMRPGFSGSYAQPYRSPSNSYSSGASNRSYSNGGSYGGSSGSYGGSNIARNPSGGGFHLFGGGHSSNNYGGGSYKALNAPSFSGGSRSWGGGGGSYKAPHFSSGGGGHFGGGGSHYSGGHSGGGGHSSGSHSGGKHH